MLYIVWYKLNLEMSSRNTINETNKNSDNHFPYKPQKLHQEAECRPSLGGGGVRCERQQSVLNLELEMMEVNGKLVLTIKFWAVILFVHFKTRYFIFAIDIAISVLNILY